MRRRGRPVAMQWLGLPNRVEETGRRMAKAEKTKDFESSLKELEEIVSQLEAGDLPLERSLELFERGIKLSRECQKRLDEAERKLEMLVKSGSGEVQIEDLPEPGDD